MFYIYRNRVAELPQENVIKIRYVLCHTQNKKQNNSSDLILKKYQQIRENPAEPWREQHTVCYYNNRAVSPKRLVGSVVEKFQSPDDYVYV